MVRSKKTSKKNEQYARMTAKSSDGSDRQRPAWSFDRADKEGMFAFSLDRDDLDAVWLFRKLVDISGLTWQEIKQQTHDNGRTKSHFISDPSKWSTDARARFKIKCQAEEADSVFSFALNNLCRLIGIRDGSVFHVIWYDPEHRFYPIAK